MATFFLWEQGCLGAERGQMMATEKCLSGLDTGANCTVTQSLLVAQSVTSCEHPAALLLKEQYKVWQWIFLLYLYLICTEF